MVLTNHCFFAELQILLVIFIQSYYNVLYERKYKCYGNENQDSCV
jgi:hypothetical protein